jgi:hypothetical protein
MAKPDEPECVICRHEIKPGEKAANLSGDPQLPAHVDCIWAKYRA